MLEVEQQGTRLKICFFLFLFVHSNYTLGLADLFEERNNNDFYYVRVKLRQMRHRQAKRIT